MLLILLVMVFLILCGHGFFLKWYLGEKLFSMNAVKTLEDEPVIHKGGRVLYAIITASFLLFYLRENVILFLKYFGYEQGSGQAAALFKRAIYFICGFSIEGIFGLIVLIPLIIGLIHLFQSKKNTKINFYDRGFGEGFMPYKWHTVESLSVYENRIHLWRKKSKIVYLCEPRPDHIDLIKSKLGNKVVHYSEE